MLIQPKFDPWVAAMMQAIPDKRVLLRPPPPPAKPKPNGFLPVWNREGKPRPDAKGAKQIAHVRNRLRRGWFMEDHIAAFVPIPPKREKVFSGAYGFGQGLVRRGFKSIGEGYFSSVYAKEGSDKVIKVCRKPDGWADYVHWAAKEGYAGTFAPKVHSYKMMNGFYVAVIERMEKTVGKTEYTDAHQVTSSLFQFAAHDHPQAIKLLEYTDPGLGQFATALRVTFKGKGDMRLDLHNDNFMVRKDGTLCLTDPVAYGKPTVPPRLKAGDFTSLASLRYFIVECSNRY